MQVRDVLRVHVGDPMPLDIQLERAIKFAIATGRLRAGDLLPTVRELAVELRINANVAAEVYAELERADVLETRPGVGTFVRDPDGGGSLDDREGEIPSDNDLYHYGSTLDE
jgi:DNA-binding transcriptional regulator YhcF (GntR family)